MQRAARPAPPAMPNRLRCSSAPLIEGTRIAPQTSRRRQRQSPALNPHPSAVTHVTGQRKPSTIAIQPPADRYPTLGFTSGLWSVSGTAGPRCSRGEVLVAGARRLLNNPTPVRSTATNKLTPPQYSSHRHCGKKATPKKPPETVTAATGALRRANHIRGVDNRVASMSPCITKDRSTQTPACACPARHSVHCVASRAR